jgi:ankyrin repeat protein
MTNNKFSRKGIAISTILLIISFLGVLGYQNWYFLLLKTGIQPNDVCSSDMNIVAIDRYINQKYNGNVNVKVTAPDFMIESPTDHNRELLLLNCAIQFDKPKIVEELLKRGADPNLLDYYDEQKYKTTSLHDAVSILAFNSRDKKTITLLLKKGANPNLSDDKGNTPLHNIAHAIGQTSYRSDKKCYEQEKTMPFDMFSLFIKYNADPNLKNNLGDTPLHIIAREDRPVEYAHLVKLGGNPLLKNNEGETAQQLNQLPKEYVLFCKK